MPAGNSAAVQRQNAKTGRKNAGGIRRLRMTRNTMRIKRKRVERHYKSNPNDRTAQSALQRLTNSGY